MKVLILAGPPASGKFTLGTVLAKRLGFSMVHNHFIYDFVSNYVVDQESQLYTYELWFYRDLFFKEAILASECGVVITHTATGGQFETDFFNKLANCVFESIFVMLDVDKKELRYRVSRPDREKTSKCTTIEELNSWFQLNPCPGLQITQPVHYVDNFDIDVAVEQIVNLLG